MLTSSGRGQAINGTSSQTWDKWTTEGRGPSTMTTSLSRNLGSTVTVVVWLTGSYGPHSVMVLQSRLTQRFLVTLGSVSGKCPILVGGWWVGRCRSRRDRCGRRLGPGRPTPAKAVKRGNPREFPDHNPGHPPPTLVSLGHSVGDSIKRSSTKSPLFPNGSGKDPGPSPFYEGA